MTTAIVIIVIYLLSAWKVWDWVRKAYSVGGIWGIINTEGHDIVAMFFPIFNTVFAIALLFYSPYKETPKPPRNYNKFFKVKK